MHSRRTAVPRHWGQRIAEQRSLLHITQEELARRVDVDITTVQKWERGERAPRPDRMPVIAAALHTSPSMLFTFPGGAMVTP